ncbi:hypothetical protein SDC9_81085 [bioreactor metagenome]|uniref:Zinc finger CHC2-type domain-containing protein n=1 Tax=bioreactor metagenome TaxID=1076179 RepID=A0A644Z1A0_9ZZZZ
MNNGATVEEFKKAQVRLIDYFNSDEAVKTPERVMRVPDFYWCKDINNRYMCKVIEYNDDRYNIKGILEISPECEQEYKLNRTPKINSAKFSKPIICRQENVDLIRKGDVEGLQKVLFGDSVVMQKVPTIEKDYISSSIVGTNQNNKLIFSNRDNFYNYIKQQIDLIEFLGVDNDKFNCIFHEENNPSASIFINEETGHYLYKCHSHNCDFETGSIIEVVQKLRKCDIPQAINFIKRVYGLEISETEWQINEKSVLKGNIQYLESGQLQEQYPTLYKRIRNYIPILIKFNEIALKYVYDEPVKGTDKVIFFSSVRYICKHLKNADVSDTNSRINLLVFLGLVVKLDENSIPKGMLEKSKEQTRLKKQKNDVTYYLIPQYTDELLQEAENYAVLFKERNMTIKGWSRELVIRTFGEEVADRVFPQFKGRPLSDESEEFAWEFDKLVLNLIEVKGYATEREVTLQLKGSKSITEQRIKKVLQETLDKYNLVRVRAGKELKKKYGIKSSGSPSIIVKNQSSIIIINSYTKNDKDRHDFGSCSLRAVIVVGIDTIKVSA